MSNFALLDEPDKETREKSMLDFLRKNRGNHKLNTPEFVKETVRRLAIPPLRNFLELDLEAQQKQTKPVFSNNLFSAINGFAFNCRTGVTQAHKDEFARDIFMNNVKDYLASIEKSIHTGRDTELLVLFKEKWSNYLLFSEYLRRLFQQNDSHRTSSKKKYMMQLSLMEFAKLIFEKEKEHLLDTIQNIINQERAGEMVDRDAIKAAVDMFVVLGKLVEDDGKEAEESQTLRTIKDVRAALFDTSMVDGNSTYIQHFHEPFLVRTREYFTMKAEEWLSGGSTMQYIKLVESGINSERERIEAYLPPLTGDALNKIINEECIINKADELYSNPISGAVVLFKQEKFTDISSMYHLLKRVDKENKIGEALLEHIKCLLANELQARESRLTKLCAKAKAPAAAKKMRERPQDPELIDGILQIHGKYLAVVKTYLNADPVVERCFHEAFTTFWNKDTSKPSRIKIFAHFIDGVIKRKVGAKKLTAEQVEKYLGTVNAMFQYMKSKDIFQHNHQELLCKRLLSGNHSLEDEKAIISQLKLACGERFTKAMEGMVADITRSAADNTAWKRTGHYENLHVDFQATVLAQANWPTQSGIEMQLPEQMQRMINEYKIYYRSKRADGGRRLIWSFDKGQVQINAKFKNGVKILQCAPIQAAVVLILGNSGPTVVNDLYSILDIGESGEFLRAAIDGLRRSRVIDTESKNKKVDETDILKINEGFKSAHRMIPIAMPSVSIGKGQSVDEKIIADRTHAIQAALVRIMKARKTLSNTQLIQECSAISSLNFEPNVRLIKRCIGELIERDYFERDEDDSSKLLYVA